MLSKRIFRGNGTTSFLLITTTELMSKGTEVILQFGPFAGLKGVVISNRRGGRVTVRAIIKDRAFLIELDEHMVEKPPAKQAARGAAN
jgi:hypothetical protein